MHKALYGQNSKLSKLQRNKLVRNYRPCSFLISSYFLSVCCKNMNTNSIFARRKVLKYRNRMSFFDYYSNQRGNV
jgi:hypothetical protein